MQDWDKPQHIPDPDAKKPDDWDDEIDGEWEPPMIDNPDYKVGGQPCKQAFLKSCYPPIAVKIIVFSTFCAYLMRMLTLLLVGSNVFYRFASVL